MINLPAFAAAKANEMIKKDFMLSPIKIKYY